jgi:DNA repair photolyase
MASSAAPSRRPPSPPQAVPAGASSSPAGPDDVTGTNDFTGTGVDRERRRGRGAQSNAAGRYEPHAREGFDDGWQSLEDLPPFATTVGVDTARKVITRNDSPDIPFDRSINPYRGCEHGCVYCFARPTHAYMGLSPGLDFESKLFAKPDAHELLERELSASNYSPRVIAIGTNTDPYQPIEKRYEVMRRILGVLERAGHPVGIVTKSALVVRDIDILARMAKRNLVKVAISVTTLDAKLARIMEPRAPTPTRRLDALRELGKAGIPIRVMTAPIVPAINDAEIERILEAAASVGVTCAGYVLLRLPLEVRDLFREWLTANFPDREKHVFTLIRQMRGGKDYDSKWGERMTGSGPYADMIRQRFEAACARLGLNKEKTPLTTEHFRAPRGGGGEQLSLF